MNNKEIKKFKQISQIKQIPKIIDLYFERDAEYKKNNKFFVSQNNKQMIHYNNMNRRLPFLIYVKVENEIKNAENAKHSESIEKERERLYKKYKYIYYPLNFHSKDEDEKVKK